MAKHRILTDDTGQEIAKALSVIAQTNIAHSNMDWSSVQAIVADGAGEKAFAIGTQLIENGQIQLIQKSTICHGK